jgi:signal transduction histidine kinase
VSVRTSGAQRHLTPALDQAAYRILQEALTNAARHGDGRADVGITYRPEMLELSVANPLREGEPRADPGHGIVGMRERAALLGGSVETDLSDGHFRVRALLPYGGESP